MGVAGDLHLRNGGSWRLIFEERGIFLHKNKLSRAQYETVG